MAYNGVLRPLATRGVVRCYGQADHLIQVEERVALCHSSMDRLEGITDVMGVVFKLHTESCLSEHTFHHK